MQADFKDRLSCLINGIQDAKVFARLIHLKRQTHIHTTHKHTQICVQMLG